MRNEKVLSIKNNSKITYTAREIANNYLHRGSAIREKIESTLHLFKDGYGIKSLKNLTQEHIDKVILSLQDKTQNGMSLSNANSYISSLNNIIRYINNDGLSLIRASDYGLSRNISEKDGINKENSREAAEAYKEWLNQKYAQTRDLGYEALKHAVSIQSANLRLRESLLIKLQNKDLFQNILKISEKGDGSKNSRAREIKLNPEQKDSLLEARQFLKDNNLKNLNIGTIKQGRDFANNALKSFRQETGQSFHYHGERHYAAHEVYKEAWQAKGNDIECRARTRETKQDWQNRIISETGLNKAEFTKLDKEIRQEISIDLGHERIEITSRYLG